MIAYYIAGLLWLGIGVYYGLQYIKAFRSNPNYEMIKDDKFKRILFYIISMITAIVISPLALLSDLIEMDKQNKKKVK